MSGDLSGLELLRCFEKRSMSIARITRLSRAVPALVRARLSALEHAGYLARRRTKAPYHLTERGKAAVISGQAIYE